MLIQLLLTSRLLLSGLWWWLLLLLQKLWLLLQPNQHARNVLRLTLQPGHNFALRGYLRLALLLSAFRVKRDEERKGERWREDTAY